MPTPRVSRRRFLGSVGATAIASGASGAAAGTRQGAPLKPAGSFTDIGGVRVGHFTDVRRPTGCTAILFDKPATAGADYDGSAPAESLGVMLQPVSPLDQIHGILFAGGGPMGLGATAGVVRHLEEQQVGYDWGVPNVRVPIVVGAAIDDLAIGDGRIRVGPDEAVRACRAATAGPVGEGSVGAGAGATVGKMFAGRGMRGMKGGVGSAAARHGAVSSRPSPSSTPQGTSSTGERDRSSRGRGLRTAAASRARWRCCAAISMRVRQPTRRWPTALCGRRRWPRSARTCR